MATSIPFAVRGSTGVHVAQGPPAFGTVDQFVPIDTKSCRAICFSPNGQYMATASGQTLKLWRTDTWTDVATIEGTKAYFLVFSPLSRYLMTWEPYEVSKDKPQGSPNLNLYKCENGELVKGFMHKSQTNWEPKWSDDEKIFSKLQNNDVIFYEDCNFEYIIYRINCFKVASYSICSTQNAHHVICHMPGGKGQPAFARLFAYPKFEAQQALACKSFFNADSVEYFWNSKGTHCILLTTTEQDKTGKSYYGKQSLHFIGINGSTNVITLAKEGPIYSVAWSPKGHEFCVVYGFMPAKASIFNLKSEVIFELGTGPRNAIYYNPHGNILLLGGFGNLRGNVETWDIVKRKQIGTCDASDTTMLEWSPDGMHFLTATTAPRLRIGNGYKIWHYSGALMHEKDVEELYEVRWKRADKTTFKEPVISTDKVESIATKKVQASTQAYRPPSARNRPGVIFNLHDDHEPAKQAKESAVSKNALKQRKKREAKKARKDEEKTDDKTEDSKPQAIISSVQVVLTGDVEKDKKIKNIKKKLDAIEKLKADKAAGKPLEINQLSKINGESDLLKELKQLQI